MQFVWEMFLAPNPVPRLPTTSRARGAWSDSHTTWNCSWRSCQAHQLHSPSFSPPHPTTNSQCRECMVVTGPTMYHCEIQRYLLRNRQTCGYFCQYHSNIPLLNRWILLFEYHYKINHCDDRYYQLNYKL